MTTESKKLRFFRKALTTAPQDMLKASCSINPELRHLVTLAQRGMAMGDAPVWLMMGRIFLADTPHEAVAAPIRSAIFGEA